MTEQIIPQQPESKRPLSQKEINDIYQECQWPARKVPEFERNEDTGEIIKLIKFTSIDSWCE